MKLSELKDLIDRHMSIHSGRDDPEVVVRIHLPYTTVGGQSHSPVRTVQAGFDWDRGKFFVVPENELTPADRDFAEQMKNMQEQLGREQIENRRLKSQVRRLETAQAAANTSSKST
jgi:hypothetical protein